MSWWFIPDVESPRPPSPVKGFLKKKNIINCQWGKVIINLNIHTGFRVFLFKIQHDVLSVIIQLSLASCILEDWNFPRPPSALIPGKF